MHKSHNMNNWNSICAVLFFRPGTRLYTTGSFSVHVGAPSTHQIEGKREMKKKAGEQAVDLLHFVLAPPKKCQHDTQLQNYK